MESLFAEVRILDCKAVDIVDFFGIFEILEHPFLSEHFQNVSVVQSRSRL